MLFLVPYLQNWRGTILFFYVNQYFCPSVCHTIFLQRYWTDFYMKTFCNNFYTNWPILLQCFLVQNKGGCCNFTRFQTTRGSKVPKKGVFCFCMWRTMIAFIILKLGFQRNLLLSYHKTWTMQNIQCRIYHYAQQAEA